MRRKKNKELLEKKYIILLSILIIFLIIGLLSLIIRDDRNLSLPEMIIKDTGNTIIKIILTPFTYIGNKINDYQEMKHFYHKYKDKVIDEYSSKVIEIENVELKDNIKELKNILDLNNTLTEYNIVNATVISRNKNWFNTINIDKGSNDGLKEDMIVISKGGLIGKIIKTSFYTSEVKLITTSNLDLKISVSIKHDDNYTYGILSGYNKDSKLLLVNDIIDNTNITKGDLVLTSGLSETYPKGIIVGYVDNIKTDHLGISKIISVKSEVDFNNIFYVSVLKEAK